MVEQTPAGQGKGYSKKESQQEAAHETLNKIKNDPQFIDTIFAEKAAREQTAAHENEPSSTEATIQPNTETASALITAEEGLNVEESTEKYDDVERIIAEAEEAAFQITESSTEETEKQEEEKNVLP